MRRARRAAPSLNGRTVHRTIRMHLLQQREMGRWHITGGNIATWPTITSHPAWQQVMRKNTGDAFPQAIEPPAGDRAGGTNLPERVIYADRSAAIAALQQ